MAKLLMKLRNVPEDELVELYALLDEHAIDYYETSAGNWGMSMPGLWLDDESQIELAQSLLKNYEQERLTRIRSEYEDLKQAGQARTLGDMIRENPIRFMVYVACIGALVYFSIVPFFSFST